MTPSKFITSPNPPDHTLSSSSTIAPQQHVQFTHPPTMTHDYETPSADSTLRDPHSTLIDPPLAPRTVDEVWRQIVAGKREIKAEKEEEEGMMTLEDFLVKAGAVEEVKTEVVPETLSGYGVDSVVGNGSNAFSVLDETEGSIVGYGSNGVMDSEITGGSGGGGGGGRGKRGRSLSLMEPLDKAAAQRQRRMIKNRESAARSRERKQAYQIELESLSTRLEEENERMLKEKEERTKERFKQLMEKVIPVMEKRRLPRPLRRVRSFEW